MHAVAFDVESKQWYFQRKINHCELVGFAIGQIIRIFARRWASTDINQSENHLTEEEKSYQ